MILVEFISVHGTEDRNVDATAAGHGNFVHLVTSVFLDFIRKSLGSIDSFTFELGSRRVSCANAFDTFAEISFLKD